jgi:hypothetical protein
MPPRPRRRDRRTSWPRLLARALVVEGTHLAAIAALAASFILLFDSVLGSHERRWGGRTASEWRPSLTSPIAAARDSALAAQRTLAPFASRTVRAAAAMLSDPDEGVSTSALHALLEAAHGGGATLVLVRQEVHHLLDGGNARARARAARVAGALGALGGPLVPALLAASRDTAEAVRAAVATALGGTLEAAPQLLTARVRGMAVDHLVRTVRDPAWLVREAALEALFRAAPADARVGAIVATALKDPSAEVRERAASIETALKGRGYASHGRD